MIIILSSVLDKLVKDSLISIICNFVIAEPANAAMHGPHSRVRIGPGCAGRT